MASIAERMFDGTDAEAELEVMLADAGIKFKRLGWDYYDCSVELYNVPTDFRLSDDMQRIIHAAGFVKAYVNHEDGWETHYTWGGDGAPVRGWRRRWVEDAKASTTRSVGLAVAPDNAGYYEISYWPDSWNSPSTENWLSSGYMRIVPDPIDVATMTAPQNR